MQLRPKQSELTPYQFHEELNGMDGMNRAQRRKLETYERLKAATAALLHGVGYHRLTIKAITEYADLGYGTFYLHFSDKDAAVWDVLKEQMDATYAAIDSALEGVPFPLKEFLSWRKMFEFIHAERMAFQSLFGPEGSVTLNHRYQAYLVEAHEYNLRNSIYQSGLEASPPVEFMAQFGAGALMRLLLWWTGGENDYSPHDMASMLFQMVYRQPPPSLPEASLSV